MSPQERKWLLALRVSVLAGFVVGVFCLYVLDWEAGFLLALGLGLVVAMLLRLTVFR